MKFILAQLVSGYLPSLIFSPKGELDSARMIFRAFNLYKKEIRVHAELCVKIKQKDGISLWYLLRAMDKQGRGEVKLSISLGCLALGVNKDTLFRYFHNNKLFGRVRKRRNFVTINYKSQIEVAKAYQIKFGHCGFTLLGDLIGQGRVSMTITAIALTATSLQNASWHTVRERLSGESKQIRKKLKILPQDTEIFFAIQEKRYEYTEKHSGKKAPHKLATGVIKNSTRGALVYGSGLYLDCSMYAPFGVSQQRIADELDLSRRYVNALLRKHHKIRLYLTDSPEYMEKAQARAAFHDSEKGTTLAQRFFVKRVPPFNGNFNTDDGYRVWQSSVCLYNPIYALSSFRFTKNALKLATKEPDSNGSYSTKDYLNNIDYNQYRLTSRS